ncbi:hypothetical protein ABT173_46570 [Streptomyces sp. NPDC001795]|uniref:hypothetical protein n=1 Tax=unclassified Streptomyces TaxID=2593676 RepID=UPI00333327EA
MQHPAVPELAHTTTRPIHWVATATAISGVIALSSMLHPGSATAAQPRTETKAAPATTAPPDPAKADFPLNCGPTRLLVQKKATGDLDGDGRPETVVLVHCDSSMGTPPDAVYVLTQAAGTPRPRVVATLVDPKDRLTVTDFALRDAVITATLLGYSSSAVPNCCPDVKTPAKWQWKGGAFIRSTPSGAQNV